MIIKLSCTDYPSVLFRLEEKKRCFHFFMEALSSGHEKKLFSYTPGDGRVLYILVTSGLIVHLAGDSCLDGESADFINSLEWKMLISPTPVLAGPGCVIRSATRQTSFLMVLDRSRIPSDCRQARILKSAGDFHALTLLYDRIEGFSGIYSCSREDFIRKGIEGRSSRKRIVAAIGGKELKSSATRSNDVIVSVCTDPRYRRNGYASKTLRRLINHAFSSDGELDELYLFYETEEAGGLYMKLGFENVVSYEVLKR